MISNPSYFLRIEVSPTQWRCLRKRSIGQATLARMGEPLGKINLLINNTTKDLKNFRKYFTSSILNFVYSYKDYLTYSRLGCSRRHLKGSKYEPMREDRLTSRLFHKFQIANR